MADHTAIENDIHEQLELGDRAAARTLARRYTNGADPELAQHLIDRAHATLRAETETYTERLTAERRARYRAETTHPRQPVAISRGSRQPIRTNRAANAERKAQQYFDNRDTNPQENRRDTTPAYGSGGLDNEQQATITMRGRACLACDLERTPADRANNDGLCTECRDAGLTRTDAINTQCARITQRARATNTNPRDALLTVWRKVNKTDRARIVEWVEAHRSEIT